MNRNQLIMVLLFSLFIFGCKLRNSKTNIDEDKAFAEQCLSALKTNDIEAFKSSLDQRIIEQGIEQNLAPISKLFSQGEIVSEELVSWGIFYKGDIRRTQLNYQYQFKDSWVLVNIGIETVGQTKKITLLNVNPLPSSLKEINKFVFTGKNPVQYIILLSAVIIPVFIVFAFVICIGTKLKARKWLWLIFILFGIGNLTLNWTTGQILFNPLYVLLLGSGFSKASPYAPVIFTLSLPLGAILFLIMRNSLKAPEPVEISQSDIETDASAENPEDTL